MIMLICVSSVLDEETTSREKGFYGAASGTTSLLRSSTSLLQLQGKQNWLPWQLHLSGKPGSMARGSSLGMLRPLPAPLHLTSGCFLQDSQRRGWEAGSTLSYVSRLGSGPVKL